MTDQKLAGLEKLAALGAHTAFSLQILFRPFRQKVIQPCGKSHIKGIAFSPKLIVVDGFKIAPTKFGETDMRERKENSKADLRTLSKKEFWE